MTLKQANKQKIQERMIEDLQRRLDRFERWFKHSQGEAAFKAFMAQPDTFTGVDGSREARFSGAEPHSGPSSVIAATAYYLRRLKSRSALPPSTASFSPAVRNRQCLRT